MNRAEKIASLKAMLRQVAPDRDVVESLIPSAEALDSVGGAHSAETTRTALEFVALNRDDLSDAQIDSLEAIVLPRQRPVAFVKNDRYTDLEDPWTHLNADVYRDRLSALLPSIGRIEVPGARVPYGGTGFVVGYELLMTNRHVAELFAKGLGSRGLVFRSGDAAVDFHREYGDSMRDNTARFNVVQVVMIHPYWDMALLRVSGLGGRKPLRLSNVDPADLIDRQVLVAGYPARDDRRNAPDVQDRIFNSIYEVKRVQPGRVRPRTEIVSFERRVNALTHDASTLGGNSGSALLDVETGEVLALHFAGEYLKANYAVPAFDLARDGRVVDVGVNFAGPASPPGEWASVWKALESDESTRPPKVQAPAADEPLRTAANAALQEGTTLRVVIPLEVTISVGAPIVAGAVSPRSAEQEKVPVVATGLARRRGYDTRFLGTEDVPLPELTAKGEKAVARLADGGAELRYHHFTVVMHKRRRVALFTAANVDWTEARRNLRDDGKNYSRAQLRGFTDGEETWVIDERIPRNQQLPDVFFTRDQGAFDKGHIVRRDDVAWGRDFDDIQKANGDTYHVTNCSPQVKGYNRSTEGKDNWGDLEAMVERQTRGSRVIVFAGPDLDPEDEYFDGRGEGGEEISVQIPRRFWKIVVAKTAGGDLRAYGFVLDQDLSAVPTHRREEGFAVPNTWRRHMARIADIEGMLHGCAKLSWLVEHDGYDSGEGVALRAR